MSRKPAANAPCPCGSGKKFKKCCGDPSRRVTGYFHAAIALENAGLKPTPILSPGTAPWLLDSGMGCPCGSTKPYEECCEPVIAKHKGTISEDASRSLGEGDFVQAETLYRAYLAQYLEWVYAHTLPLVTAKIPVTPEIVDIDKKALAEIADMIAHCLHAMGRDRETLALMDHVEAVVPLPGFEKDVAYLRAQWLYIGLKDRNGAIRELKKLGEILDYPRREAWELYLDVAGSDMTEREKITVAEHIVAEADEDEHVRVQYTVLKALALVQIGEADSARKEFEELLADVKRPSQIETSDELSAEWQIAKAWSMYGELYSDTDALRKAEEALRRIPENMLKPAGVAALQRDLGWTLRDPKRYCDAADAFRRSLEYEDTQVGRVHLIHALALCGKVDEARIYLQSLDPTAIASSLQLEYFAAKGSLAIASDDAALATETVGGLRGIALQTPYWDAQRSELLVQMLDFIHRPDARPKTERQSAIVKILIFMNDVLELKPNFFGLGVNINGLQMHFARKGLITEEMAYVAQREKISPSSSATKSPGRMIIPANINHPSSSRWPSASNRCARSTPTSATRPSLEHRRRAAQAAHRRPLRRRHGDGPLHRRRHSDDSRGDPAPLARPHRHRADL
jgi:tetratricopeptide (TPR) repeat protein